MTTSLRFLLHKIFHWEYWPQWLVYAPVAPVYIGYAVKAGSPFFMVAANPGLENGGYMMESKYTIHRQLPQQLVPETFLAHAGAAFSTIQKDLACSGIKYPFFCKPDIGGRGRGVEKIEDELQLKKYHETSPLNYLVQAAIPYQNEIGIFYCRLPWEKNGFISGMVKKHPVQVKGDGVHTLRQLIEAVPRYYFQRKFLFSKYAKILDTVLPAGQPFLLSAIGNHARGALFTDCTSSNTHRLEKLIDAVSKNCNGFCFGRYDIKFNSWEELYEGKNFMIVELNGSGSEPAHIYDPSKNIWQAWQIILRHWKLMYSIAAAHHRNGVSYPSFKEGRQLQRKEKELAAKFKMREKRNNDAVLNGASPRQHMNVQLPVAKKLFSRPDVNYF